MTDLKNDLKTIRTDSDKEWLHNIIADPEIPDVRVTFTKKDGTVRILECTLVTDRIPMDKHPKSETIQEAVGDSLRVFDTQLGEWRSFRYDSVTKVEFGILS